ncbi:MAG: M23 family metallopeptidase [Spirochaetes bacterium]|nr:M23 family metallopeptidase [Spirochaetota bacterium]MBN2769925.1 M23 family metallopeptidase [Spirochaetota bacterium]
MGLNPFKDADLYDLETYLCKRMVGISRSVKSVLSSFISGINRKGNEKITLMFIPHSEKRIINFHISIYSIVIFSFFLVSVVTTTTIMIMNHTTTIKEINRLRLYGYDSQMQISHYKKEINSLHDTFQKFKPELTYLYSLTPDNYVDSLWAKGGATGDIAEAPVSDEEQSDFSVTVENSNTAPDIEELNIQEMGQELKTTKEVLKKIKVFLSNRKKIIENTPSIWPAEGYLVKSSNDLHNGIKSTRQNGVTISTFPGAEIKAAAPGTVSDVLWDDEYGLTITIVHKYGFSTIYSHCQRATVKVDQKISKGEIIGYVGKTGNAMDHKLFYQIKIGMDYIDPLPYLNKIYRPVPSSISN